jgi:hypothetical protein
MKDIVALSGGKDSTALALWLHENEPREYTYICTPTGNENTETLQHWLRLKEILKGEFIFLTAGKSLQGMIRDTMTIPNWRMRWCTFKLKIKPAAEYMMQFSGCTLYIGIRADEEEREGGDYSNVPGAIIRMPLREHGIDINGVRSINERYGIKIPDRTDCKLCFFQTLAEWYFLWRDDLDSWMEGEQLEQLTGFTFRSPGRDTWPAAMKDLRALFESGKIPERSIGMKMKAMQCRVCRL